MKWFNLVNFLINNPCEDPNVLKIILFIRKIMEIAFIAIPLVLIVLITFDFVKSVTANSEDTMKKNQKIVIKRLVYAVMLFFVMPIVNLAFSAFGTSGNENLISNDFDEVKVNYLSCWDNAKDIDTIEEFEITATFDANGGKIYGDNEKKCGGSSFCEITAPIVSRKGYTFYGWSLDNTAVDNYFYKTGEKIKINRYQNKFYACWDEKCTKEYLVNNNDKDDNNSFGTYTINESNYYIIDNAKNFSEHSKNSNFYQGADSSKWGDSCLGFSMVYAEAIKIKDFNIINNQPGLVKGNSPTLKQTSFNIYSSDDKKLVLDTAYIHLKNNKPVIVQVNGNAEGTSRHYSVMIGYKKNVDSSNLKETDFLLLDVWDSQIEQMNGKGNPNGADGYNSRFMITGHDRGSDYGYQLYLLDGED